MVTVARLREVLGYDPESGLFTRLVQARSHRVGDIAGCKWSDGYVYIRLDGRLYLAHRLAWLYVPGKWPLQQIDHINGIRDDNRILNLRPATHSENLHNRHGANRDSASGVLGVCWNKRNQKWVATLTLDGACMLYSYHSNLTDAVAARREAEKKHFGVFAPC